MYRKQNILNHEHWLAEQLYEWDRWLKVHDVTGEERIIDDVTIYIGLKM